MAHVGDAALHHICGRSVVRLCKAPARRLQHVGEHAARAGLDVWCTFQHAYM